MITTPSIDSGIGPETNVNLNYIDGYICYRFPDKIRVVRM